VFKQWPPLDSYFIKITSNILAIYQVRMYLTIRIYSTAKECYNNDPVWKNLGNIYEPQVPPNEQIIINSIFNLFIHVSMGEK